MEMFAAQLMKSCFRVETLLLHSPPPPPKPIPSLLAQCKPRLVQVGDGKVDMILGIKVAFSQCGRPWTLSTYYHNQRHVSVLCIFRAALLFLLFSTYFCVGTKTQYVESLNLYFIDISSAEYHLRMFHKL